MVFCVDGGDDVKGILPERVEWRLARLACKMALVARLVVFRGVLGRFRRCVAMRCEQCGSESGREQSGISKKNGKPWRGWRCDDCDSMTWLAADGGSNGGSDGVVRGNAQGGGGVGEWRVAGGVAGH